MPHAIARLSLVVRDYDEAIDFFTRVLRFALVEDTTMSSGKRWVVVAPRKSAGAELLLAKAVTPEQESRIGNQTGGRVFLFLHTDDFRGDYEHMQACGVRFVEAPRIEPYGTVIVFQDLYGNKWDMIQPHAPASEPGAGAARDLEQNRSLVGGRPDDVTQLHHDRPAIRFHKYQALGNDYLVLEVPDESTLGEHLVRRICDRHFGIGSDGILLGKAAPSGDGFALRILNPDGSEAEKSGNGLRIFARYLWDAGRVGDSFFPVVTKVGTVRCQVRESGRTVFVEMGQASFASERIPVAGPKRDVVGEEIEVDGQHLRFTGVTVGNPHCVIHGEQISPALARRLGPLVEAHALFPNRTNVQLVQVLAPDRIQIEIWERGAGYTLASGSSSCAAAAASVRLGLCSREVTVLMPGGTLEIGVGDDFMLTMLGAVGKVAAGTLSRDLLEDVP